MKNYKIYQLVLLLTPFVFSFAIGLDIYIPVVPQMTQIFDTTPALIQLTLSLFLFISGVGQLIIGPLSDQFGRKKILYLSAACFAIGSLGCAYSTHIFWLIFCRVISSFGACGMLVTSFALVRDLYSSEKSAQIYSFLNGTIGVSPTFAPILGGYLASYFGWQSVFFCLVFIGCASLMLTRKCIGETHPVEKRIPVNLAVFKRYLGIFCHREFIIYALIAGCAEAVFFCFFSISPFIIIDLHGIPTHEFGYYFAVFGIVISLGGFGSGRFIEKVGIQRMIAIGLALMVMGGVSMLYWHYMIEVSLEGFLIPMAISCTGAMFILGASAAAALEPFGEYAGTASAAFGTCDFGISAIAGSLLMLFPTTSVVPYAFTILVVSFLSLGLFLARGKTARVSVDV